MNESSEVWNGIWDRVRGGCDTLVVGASTPPPGPSDLKLFRVDCSPPWTTKGPLLEVCQTLEQLLGEDSDVAGTSRADDSGLWEQRPLSKVETVFVEACNRVSQWGKGHCAVVFESLDQADDVTLQSLAEILTEKGWLNLPLVLCASTRSPAKVAEIATMLGLQSEIVEAPETADAQTAAHSAYRWESLPPEVLRVMRGASVIGQTFEARLLARLLDESLGSVLHYLQMAADAGAPIADRRGGKFSLPHEALGSLQRNVLPSLLGYLNQRVGELLSEAGGPLEQADGPAAEVAPEPPACEDSPSETVTASDFANTSTPEIEEGTERLAEVFESGSPSRAAATPADEAPAAAEPAVIKGPSGAPSESQSAHQSERDQARAAAHLEAAGKTEEAVRQYLAAVRELSARGEVRRALMLNDQALGSLDDLPAAPSRALLKAELLLERGRLQWQGSGLGPPFLLQDALATVEQASASLPSQIPRRLQGELAGLKAAICYDLGDLQSLEKALETLTSVSRKLVDAGDSTHAARLLNDQAAIYLRQGDPVRATHLLSQSRQLFSKLLAKQPSNSALLTELAETEHLLARLVLHARIRSAREGEAYTLSLQYARRAERVYQQLGRQRELARIWETMARLQLAAGQPDTAWQLLSAAVETQREIGDLTGLARSAAALADFCMTTGRLAEGIQLLADSISLNHRKGSPIGLAFNRRGVDKLGRLLESEGHPDSSRDREALRAVSEMLERAEAEVGRIGLPDDPRRVPESG